MRAKRSLPSKMYVCGIRGSPPRGSPPSLRPLNLTLQTEEPVYSKMIHPVEVRVSKTTFFPLCRSTALSASFNVGNVGLVVALFKSFSLESSFGFQRSTGGSAVVVEPDMSNFLFWQLKNAVSWHY